MDPVTRIIHGIDKYQHVLAVARSRARLGGVQKRRPGTLSERVVGVRNPSYRPTAVCAAGDAGEWRVERIGDRRCRVFIRNRPVVQPENSSATRDGTAPRARNARLAGRRTRPIIVFPVPAVPRGPAAGDRVSQLPAVCDSQREAQSVRRGRFLPKNRQSPSMELLLRRRSGWGWRAERDEFPWAHCALIPAVIAAFYLIFPY